MDRIINNESIVICSVLEALNRNVHNIAELYLYVVLSADKAIRDRVEGYEEYKDFVQRESAYYQALNRKFVEFQPIFLNAMTMLLLGGMIEKKSEYEYVLTVDGISMLVDLHFKVDGVETSVRKAIKHLVDLLPSKDVNTLYKDLKIVL